MLNTERLLLRKFSPDDVDFLYRLDNDENVNRYRSTSSRSFQYCEEQIDRWRHQYHSVEHNVYLMEEKLSGERIGMIFLVKPGPVYYLGYRLLQDSWRKGYTYEASLRMLAGHFSVSTESVYAETHPDNIPSMGLLYKLGFSDVTEDSNKESKVFELSSYAWRSQ